ncbi:MULTISPECIES: DUF4426 domain-containing protein [unclassified Endozoicomonas]|uniref:DUF4426 domain-containing protein n=1 Tax=unclassified Endozoicomonas TaxID=2644528 RepID=UPI0021476254|nr:MULTISPECIES: DUF4426 domain-containing protein [unclassified Endozoicomonas]
MACVRLFSLLLALAVFSGAHAAPVPEARVMNDKPARFGDYEVYYSAFPSTFIQPDIAKTYDLERGPKNGLVNMVVRNVRDSEEGKAVKASFDGKTANLLGQQSALKFKEIREGDAIYYLAGFRFSNEEMLKFTIKVHPEGASQSHTIQFSQKFYEGGQ